MTPQATEMFLFSTAQEVKLIKFSYVYTFSCLTFGAPNGDIRTMTA